MKAWGLIHSTPVMVPSIRTVCVVSKAASPWCAQSTATLRNNPAAETAARARRADRVSSRLKRISCLKLMTCDLFVDPGNTDAEIIIYALAGQECSARPERQAEISTLRNELPTTLFQHLGSKAVTEEKSSRRRE